VSSSFVYTPQNREVYRNIITKHLFTVEDTEPKGNCGYIALLHGLKNLQKIDQKDDAFDLREKLETYRKKNQFWNKKDLGKQLVVPHNIKKANLQKKDMIPSDYWCTSYIYELAADKYNVQIAVFAVLDNDFGWNYILPNREFSVSHKQKEFQMSRVFTNNTIFILHTKDHFEQLVLRKQHDWEKIKEEWSVFEDNAKNEENEKYERLDKKQKEILKKFEQSIKSTETTTCPQNLLKWSLCDGKLDAYNKIIWMKEKKIPRDNGLCLALATGKHCVDGPNFKTLSFIQRKAILRRNADVSKEQIERALQGNSKLAKKKSLRYRKKPRLYPR